MTDQQILDTIAVAQPRVRRQVVTVSPRSATIISFVTILIVWHVASAIAGLNTAGEHYVPNVIDIANSVKKLGFYWSGGFGVEATNVGGELTWAGAGLSLLFNSAATLWRLAAGLVLGSVVGVALAVIVSWSAIARKICLVPAHIARMLPMLALVSLFALWFGSSELGAILFIAFASFATIFFVTLTAIANIPSYYSQSSLSMGASRLRTYLEVVLPASLPQLRAGFILALGFGWSAVIAAELLGMQTGLGHIVVLAQFYGNVDILALIGIITVVYAATSYYIANRAFGYLTRWAEDSQ